MHRLTRPGALYFSICFAQSDPQFGGTGKYRNTRIGTTLYFSSDDEIWDLVGPYFTIRELRTVDILNKFGPPGIPAGRTEMKRKSSRSASGKNGSWICSPLASALPPLGTGTRAMIRHYLYKKSAVVSIFFTGNTAPSQPGDAHAAGTEADSAIAPKSVSTTRSRMDFLKKLEEKC